MNHYNSLDFITNTFYHNTLESHVKLNRAFGPSFNIQARLLTSGGNYFMNIRNAKLYNGTTNTWIYTKQVVMKGGHYDSRCKISYGTKLQNLTHPSIFKLC